MHVVQARVGIVAVFVLGLVIQAVFVILPFLRGYIDSDDVQALLLKLLDVYSVHLAVVFGGIFGQARSGRISVSRAAFWVAFILAVIWNLLLLWRSLSFGLMSIGTVKDLKEYLEAVASASSFLVAGSLAYFFSERSDEA
jgi:hypothetical protein